MTKYEVRPLERDDVRAILSDTPEANLWGMMGQERIDALLKTEAWTGLADGQIVACGGIISIWPGLAEAWIAVTPIARQHTHFLYRHVLAFLALVTDEYSLRRIEAHVNADFSRAVVFAERLGFKIDAPLLKYGPNGETFYLMSRVN